MLKKIIIHIRTSARLIVLVLIGMFLIIGFMYCQYRPIYNVSVNGEFIGYCANKNELKAKINKASEDGQGGNEAFIQIENMPEYKLCFLKRNVNTNEEEIYNKIISSGTTYYKMYALVENGEEKLYMSNFEDAENVVNQLKEKDSLNKDNISIAEQYVTQLKELTNVEESVAKLYVKPSVSGVKVAMTKTTKVKQTTSSNTMSNNKVNLGINLITPTKGIVTSRFGQRARNNHKGIDIGAPKGTPIYAAASGTVIYSGNRNDGYGNYIILNNGNGITTYYAHCSELLASLGQHVEQGQLIGKVGSTGNSTGNHLHFEVRVNGTAQNPQNYVY